MAHPHTRTLLPWLIAGTLVLVASWVITSQILLFTGWQRAIWMSVEATATDPNAPPPAINVAYDNPNVLPMPVVWDNERPVTFIGVQPLTNTQPLQIVSILTRTGTFALDQVQLPARGWQLQPAPAALVVGSPGLMALPAASLPITLTLAAGAGTGTVALDWLDQHTEVNLEAQRAGTYTVTLGLPATYRGWVLLPPEQIKQLHIDVPRGGIGYTLHGITIFDDAQQRWTAGAAAAGGRPLPGCNVVSTEVCRVALPDVRVINGVPRHIQVEIWFGVALAGFVLLWLLALVARRVRRWDARYEIVDGTFGTWLRERTGRWSIEHVALVVGLITLTYHLAYALFVPIWYTGDSTSYYAYGWNFLRARGYEGLFTNRPPGYAMFIAFTIALFGHQVQGVVLLQHLALGLLGPATVWFLYARTNPLVAACAGLLAGLTPVVSITANIIWTESLFTVAFTACVLLFFSRQRLLTAFGSGVLAALATMVRPNGTVVLALLLGWLFLVWWCRPRCLQALPRTAAVAGLILGGYLLIMAPWLRYYHTQEGHWGITSLDGWLPQPRPQPAEIQHLTDASIQAAWINSTTQHRIDGSLAINRPYLMLFRPEAAGNLPPQMPLLLDILWSHWYDNRFPAEGVRESIRQAPRAYLQNVYEAFRFNLLNSRPTEAQFYMYDEIHYAANVLTGNAYPQSVAGRMTAEDIDVLVAKPWLLEEQAGPLLGQMAYRWSPPRSHVQIWLLRFSGAFLDRWKLIVLLALGSSVLGIFVARYRFLVAFNLFLLAMMAAPAAIGMGVERYVAVVEPLLYIMGVLVLFAVCCLRVRRRVTVNTEEPVEPDSQPGLGRAAWGRGQALTYSFLSTLTGLPQRIRLLRPPQAEVIVPWLLVAVLTTSGAWFVTKQILLLTGWQRAVWVSVEATAPNLTAPPPAITIATDNATRLPMPVVWDNSRERMQIGVQPISMTQPLQIIGITTARGTLPLDQLRIPPAGWQYQAAPPAVLATQAGLMSIPATSPTTTLTLAAGPGAGIFALDWLDQHTEINLDAQPAGAYTVTLGLPATYRGWVLLPPEQIRHLRVLLPAVGNATLERITVFDATQRLWNSERIAALTQAAGCSTQVATGKACVFDLPDVGTLNNVPRRVRGSLWMSFTLLGLLGFGLLAALSRRLGRWHTGYELFDTPTCLWLRHHTSGWTRRRVVIGVATIAIGYHLAYAYVVPAHYTPDSLAYYLYGWRLRQMWSLDAVYTIRTPGYPLFLAILIWAFGHQLYGILLVQHLALALLGPAVAWFLYPRTSPVFALLGGLLAGICPAIAVTGSVIWTEASFTVVTCLSLLVLLGQRRRRDTLLAGLLIGIATMIRPNGLVLLALALGWLFLRWWCADARLPRLRVSATTGAVLLAGYLVITLPWYLHFHAVKGQWGLTSIDGWSVPSTLSPADVQQVTSMTDLTALINMADTQKRLRDTFAINRPYQASYRDYTLTNRSDGGVTEIVPWPVLFDNRYATEAVRESIRTQPRAYLANLYEALLFNAFGSRPEQPAYAIYGELHDALPVLEHTTFVQEYAPLGDPTKTQALLAKSAPEPDDPPALFSQMSFRWSPPASPVRTLLLWTSSTMLDHWWLIVVLAFSGLVTGALFGPCRPALFLLVYCLTMIAAPSAIGMGVERYVMVIEPVLYASAALSFYGLFCLRLRRRALIPNVAAISLLPEPGQGQA